MQTRWFGEVVADELFRPGADGNHFCSRATMVVAKSPQTPRGAFGDDLLQFVSHARARRINIPALAAKVGPSGGTSAGVPLDSAA